MDIDSVVSVIDDIISGVGDLFGFIMDNGDTIISLVAGIGTAMMTWKVASMINGVVGAVKAFQVANEGASVAQALLNGVMNANPIMLVATLLAGLIATIVTLWNTNEGFRNAVINVWNAFKDTVGNAIKSVGGFIGNLISWFQALPGRIGAFLGEVIGNVQNWASSMVSRASEAGSNFVGRVVSFIRGLPSAVWNWLSSTLNNAWNFAGQLARAGANAASGLVNNIVGKSEVFRVSCTTGVLIWFRVSQTVSGVQSIKSQVQSEILQTKSSLSFISQDLMKAHWLSMKAGCLTWWKD